MQAMMRVDNTVNDCAWLPGVAAIVVGGTAGLHTFELLLPQAHATR